MRRPSGSLRWFLVLLCCVVGSVSSVLAASAQAGIAAAATPTVDISPVPTGRLFTSGQTVTVSVGPNGVFTPHTKILILECADPQGSPANLPTSFISCDGNTLQGNPVEVQADGSIRAEDYPMYALPNAGLDEQANWVPACNRTMACVLYVGENFNDFSMPKIFSSPFYFTASAPAIGKVVPSPAAAAAAAAGGPSGHAAVAPSTTANPSGTAPPGSVSVPAATLAFTGFPAEAPWLAGLGAVLVLAGVVLRRRYRQADTP